MAKNKAKDSLWHERVAMLSINPDAATHADVARLASGLLAVCSIDPSISATLCPTWEGKDVMGYQYWKDAAGEWRWRLRAGNREIIASGESYKNLQDCLGAIELVKNSKAAAIKKVRK